MKEKSLGSAILQGKCPRCREGNLFSTSIFSFRKLTEIKDKCPHCEAVISPEPDFFMGAMFISYAFSVALVVIVMIFLNLIVGDPTMWMYGVTIIVSNLLLLPVMLRYSKVLYLYGVGKLKFDPKYSKV